MKSVSRLAAYLTPLMVVALSFGYAVGWGSFVMPGTVFLPGAGPAGTVIGILLGAAAIAVFAFNYHRMLQRVPGPGGAVSFTVKAFGADHGFLLAWFLWLTSPKLTAISVVGLRISSSLRTTIGETADDESAASAAKARSIPTRRTPLHALIVVPVI